MISNGSIFHPTLGNFRKRGANWEPFVDPALTPFRADDTHAPIGESTAAHHSPNSAQSAIPAPLRRFDPRPDQGLCPLQRDGTAEKGARPGGPGNPARQPVCAAGTERSGK